MKIFIIFFGLSGLFGLNGHSVVKKRTTRGLHANTYLYMSYISAEKMNVSKCWVCTHIPVHSREGIPLQPLPFHIAETVEWILRQNRTGKEGDMIEWESAGYEMSRFSAWYQPAYNHALLPPSLTVPSSDVRGSLCFSKSGKGKLMGQSRCNLTAEWQGPVVNLSNKGMFILDWSRVWNITSNSSWAHTTPYPG